VRPGQERKCNGCHVGNSGLSHGRYDAFDSAYAGASAGLLEFPNTDPQWFIGTPGETMAEVRARITQGCTTLPGEFECSSIEPSINVLYTDVWTADPVIRANNVDIDMSYTDLLTTSPTTLACQQDWQAQCRSVINYESIIHPLCTSCHTFPYIDPDDGVTVIPPAGQLELTDQLSIDVPDHLHAYRELLVTDNLQEVVGGQLVDVMQPNGEVDDLGNPILAPIPIGSPATIAGARASGRFFSRFEDPADTIHYDILSSAERRLIAEWLDVGAQYYNNPFDVPQ